MIDYQAAYYGEGIENAKLKIENCALKRKNMRLLKACKEAHDMLIGISNDSLHMVGRLGLSANTKWQAERLAKAIEDPKGA